MTGAELIAAERKRQIEQEGFDASHDAQHTASELKRAAHCYVLADGPDARMPDPWPWSVEWWKPKSRQRNLERAGALLLAAADVVERDKDSLGMWSLEARMLRDDAADCARLIDHLLTPNAALTGSPEGAAVGLSGLNAQLGTTPGKGNEMEDEMLMIRADVACEAARQAILRLGRFVCAHDTEINAETLDHVGTCEGCPVVETEGLHEMATEMICRRERFVTSLPTVYLFRAA